VHGVYKPGNVKLSPELLHKHQAYVKEKTSCESDKPCLFVFHGGSGSTEEEMKTAVSAGVVVSEYGCLRVCLFDTLDCCCLSFACVYCDVILLV
jgi:hypothetical protein